MTETTKPDRARAALGLAPQPDAGKAVSVVDKRIAETRSMEAAFKDAVASGIEPAQLVRDGITAIRATPKLAECDRDTFFGALMTCAQLGLRPNVASLGHGWILPFYNSKAKRHEAKWIMGYQGMVELGYRSGLVTKITAHTIFEGEPHKISWGTDDTLIHEPVLDRDDRGLPIWHYACVWLATGGVIWNAITELDAREIMARSQSGAQGFGPWRDDYLPMARKTALRGLWRWMPKTPALALALATDDVVRSGVDRDPVIVDEQPSEPTTVTRGEPESDAEAPAELPAAETQPETETQPESRPTAEPWAMADGSTRDAKPVTQMRQTYIARIISKHGEHARTVIEQVVGEWIEPAYLTNAELRAVAEYDYTPTDAEQS